jgi:hypothetical protein
MTVHVKPASHGVLEHPVKRRALVPSLGTGDSNIFVRLNNLQPRCSATLASTSLWFSVVRLSVVLTLRYNAPRGVLAAIVYPHRRVPGNGTEVDSRRGHSPGCAT